MTPDDTTGLTIDVLSLTEAQTMMSGDMIGVGAIAITADDDGQRRAAEYALRLHEHNHDDTERLVLVEAYR